VVKPRTKILASFLLAFLALALAQTVQSSIEVSTNELGTGIAGFYSGSPWSGIGVKGALRMWNGTVGTHEGGLQKWAMYWFISFAVKRWVDDNETFIGGCLVIPNWQEAYGWRVIAVRDAQAHGMKIIIIESFEELADISYSVDRYLLIKLYLDPKKTWLIPQQRQEALDYFNEIWETNHTIDLILANSASPWI